MTHRNIALKMGLVVPVASNFVVIAELILVVTPAKLSGLAIFGKFQVDGVTAGEPDEGR